MTYFNWYELLLYGRRDPAAIIILAYGQTSEYNEYSSRTLMKRLQIHRVPRFLFEKNLLQQSSKLICNYKTKEPQSYFRNPEFLFYSIPIKQKVLYLKALSARGFKSDNKIPREFFNKVASNYFLDVRDDFIHFPFESSVSKKN